jgi:hypothetical protein
MGLYDSAYDVACPTCNSGVGVRCTTLKGKHAGEKISVPHKPRQKLGTRALLDEHNKRREAAIGAKLSELQEGRRKKFSHETDLTRTPSRAVTIEVKSGEPEVRTEVVGATATYVQFTGERLRQERIAQVLWGIHFARDVMKIPRGQIDRNLAEMIVDGGLDGTG